MRSKSIALFLFAMMLLFASAAYSQTCNILDVDNAAFVGGAFAPGQAPIAPIARKLLDPTRPIAPGEVITISLGGAYGLGPATVDGAWATNLNGLTVLVGNNPTPIYSLALVADPFLPGVNAQVTFQVPTDLSTATIVFNGIPHANLGVVGANCNIGLTPIILSAIPALYGGWEGTIVEDAVSTAVNDQNHPLTSGIAAIYGYGWGALKIPLQVGEAAKGVDPLVAPVSVTVANLPATVLYAGAAPGSVGQYVLQFQVPVANLPQGFSQGQVFINGLLAGSFQVYLQWPPWHPR